MAQSDIGFQLPELSVDDFERGWIRFELIAAAKDWNTAKRLAIIPTLLRGKLIDFYTELEDATKTDLTALKTALQEKAGFKTDPLVASRKFNLRDQQPNERVNDYTSDLKRLFKQAYPDEGTNSAVLLQRFLTGLQPPVARQMLLRKKPENLSDAIENAKAVEYALAFEDAEAGLSSEPINLLHKKGNKQPEQQTQDKYLQLCQTVETLTKQVESLETSLHKVQEDPPTRPRFPQASRYDQRGRRRGRGTCHCCGQYGHFYRQCPLNFQGPAPMVDSRWSKPQTQ